MRFIGYRKFIKKVPYLSRWKGLFIPIYAVLFVKGSLTFLSFCYTIPQRWPHIHPLFLTFVPLLAVLFVELLGFFLVYQMWRNRLRLKKIYGERSYRRIIPVGFAGVVLVLSLCINMYRSISLGAPEFWGASQLSILATPLYTLAKDGFNSIFIVKNILALYFLLLGISMVFRALATFGFDYMTVVYLYFPEESSLQNHRIYSVLRHPTYTAAVLINLGGMIYTMTPFSIVFFLMFLLGFWMHIRLVEERELIERFGDSYREYRKKVPAFFVRPRNWGHLFRFILGLG